MKSLLLLSALLGSSSAFSPSTSLSHLSKLSSSTHDASTSSLCAKYKKVFVAGGSKGVGRAIIDKLVADGSEVVALVRSDDAVAELSAIEGVTAVKGDAFDYKCVEGTIDGCDAAITTLGGAPADEKRVDYEGNNNVIEAAGILGCVRVILVTSIGCGNSKEATPPPVYETLEPVLKAKNKAENILIKYYTNMNWSIIRPGGLKTEPMTGKAILTQDASKAIGSIHREDVADLVVKVLSAPNTERQIFSAVDPSLVSPHAEGLALEEFALN
jgi:nucleoside-diphosphate-sugar epimerase